MTRPILTLTTDFGLSDHFVGTMKGVILGICPQAQIVDISHDVTPFEIGDGAYMIAQAYRYFPKKTVHVVVVDPGVGTARRPVLMEAAGQYFVAPDNGVLSMVLAREESAKFRLISNTKYFLPQVSTTFHGRDIFAPVAAHLAAGVTPAQIGKSMEDYLKPGSQKPHREGKRTWMGRILHIDRFGNVITNFHTEDFGDLGLRGFQFAFGPVTVATIARNYAERAPGELFAIRGSSGFYEVSLSQGNAAKKIGCEVGASVELMVW
jgi:S-adenosylmethionine hydrolase